MAAITRDAGTEVDKPADPTRENYAFSGWFSSADGGTEYGWPHTLNADVTMHAHWRENTGTDDPAGATPASSITGVPSGGVVGVALDLSDARVLPASAPQEIVWQVKTAGNSGVTAVANNKFTATGAENSLKITAVVAGGGANNGDYTEDFTIKIVDSANFVAVTRIDSVPSLAAAGASLALTGVVQPPAATNTTIVWELLDGGTTGAVLEGLSLKTENPGAVKLRARIRKGATTTDDYTNDFYITVTSDGILSSIPGPGLYTFAGTWDPAALNLQPVADFAVGDPADFLDEALELVEPDGNCLIVLDRDYVIPEQYLDAAGAQVVILGWEEDRYIEPSSSRHFYINAGTLILGGHIRIINKPGDSTARRIELAGGNLVMYDGAFIGFEDSTGNGGAVEVGSGSAFTMHGGGIVNCAAANGGAVEVKAGGTFTLAGGVLTGNSAANGGAVHSAGTFSMSGGTLSDNTASASGGAVYSSGAFSMSGGAISANTAKTGSGGVFIATDGTFAMSGGSIRANKLGADSELIASNVNVVPTGTISDANIYGYGRVYTITLDAPDYNATTGFRPGSSLQFTPTITCLGTSYSGDIAWSTYWMAGQAATPTGAGVTVTDEGLVTLAADVAPGVLRVRVNVAGSKFARMEVTVK